MERVFLDAKDLERELIGILEKGKTVVLATCSGGRVTARSVSYINIGLDILYQTGIGFIKADQMCKNLKVSVCVGNLQIEGSSEFSGHPMDPINKEFCSLYQKKYPQFGKCHTTMKGASVVRVKPSLFTFCKYLDGRLCRDYLDVSMASAYRVFYREGGDTPRLL